AAAGPFRSGGLRMGFGGGLPRVTPRLFAIGLAALALLGNGAHRPARAQALPKASAEVQAQINRALAAIGDKDREGGVRFAEKAIGMAKLRQDGAGIGDAGRVLYIAYGFAGSRAKAAALEARLEKEADARAAAHDRRGQCDLLAVLGTFYFFDSHWQKAQDTYR